jgi:uncharacterized protein (DUF2336 family)
MQIALPLPADDQAQNDTHRVKLGANPATPAELLLSLAADPSVTVRAALALNPASPPAVLPILARDADSRVRALLGRKLATMAPKLDDASRAQLNQQAAVALTYLVEDEAVRVRAAIADVVKGMPDAPRDLVLRLAHDTALEVSEPVIRLSPILAETDLLTLLATAASAAVAIAVARRPELTESVSEAIAVSSDSTAVAALLWNSSAQIRETTLDALIARAADQTAWHEPLVRRPSLPARAAQALSEIVADTLLAELASRADLGAAVTRDLRARLAARLAKPATQDPTRGLTLAEAMAEARSRAAAGPLTEADLIAAASRGDVALTAALLAIAADVPLSVVHRVSELRSAKGLISLIWKAGFGMKVAVPVQALLGRLAPGVLLTSGPGGTFPLSVEEMRWQIGFLTQDQQ